MHAMSDEWQDKMADLLEEFSNAFPNQPSLGTRVQVTDDNGKLVKTPGWLINYRHPDNAMIDMMRVQNEQDRIELENSNPSR